MCNKKLEGNGEEPSNTNSEISGPADPSTGATPIDSDKLKAYIELFKHWDAGFWTAVQMFLVAEGLLFTAFFAARQIAEAATFPFGPVFVAVAGFALAGIWAVVLARKRTYVVGAENLLRHGLPGLYGKPGHDLSRPDAAGTLKAEQDRCAREGCFDRLGSCSSAAAVKVGLPVVIGVLWFLLLGYIVCVWRTAHPTTGAQCTSAPVVFGAFWLFLVVYIVCEWQTAHPTTGAQCISAPRASGSTKEQPPLREGEVRSNVQPPPESGPDDGAPKENAEPPPGAQERSK